MLKQFQRVDFVTFFQRTSPGVVVRGTALRAAPHRLTVVRHGWATDAFEEVPFPGTRWGENWDKYITKYSNIYMYKYNNSNSTTSDSEMTK